MPSAYGHTNGHHLVNTNSMAALTNGQTPSSMTTSSTVSPHRHGSTVTGSHVGHHQTNQTPSSQPAATIQTNEEVGIKEVWAHNLEDEFVHIRKIVQNYPYVAMDTEFPGVVGKPIGTFVSNSEFLYQIMRCNVTMLRIIQIGLTFLNAEGKKPEGYCTWQFNFYFDLKEDMYSQESIELLQNSGIQFSKHEQDGIDPTEFAVLLIGSGVVLSDNIFWLSFHSGYDFGYLLKILTDQPLPEKETEFFQLFKIFFPRVYDLKYMMKSTKDLKGGLQEVAEQLTLVRKGPQHQAGSDSLLTGETFFKLKEMYFENDIEEKRYSGFIYGLETAETGKTEPDDDLIISTSATTMTTNNTTSTTQVFIMPGTRNTNSNNNMTSSNQNNNNTNGSTINNNNSNNNNNNNTGANNNDITTGSSGDDTITSASATIANDSNGPNNNNTNNNNNNNNNNNTNSLGSNSTNSSSSSTSLMIPSNTSSTVSASSS